MADFSSYPPIAQQYSVDYQTLILLLPVRGGEPTETFLRFAPLDVAVTQEGWVLPYPAYDDSGGAVGDARVQNEWGAAVVGGVWDGKLMSCSPIKRVMTDVQIGGGASELEEQTFSFEVSDQDGAIRTALTNQQFDAKGSLVFVFIVPRDGSPGVVATDPKLSPFHLSTAQIKDYNLRDGVIRFIAADFTSLMFNDLVAAVANEQIGEQFGKPITYNTNYWPLMDPSLAGKPVPIVYGRHISSPFNLTGGAVSLQCVDGNTEDRDLKNRTFVVGAGIIRGARNVWLLNLQTNVYTFLTPSVDYSQVYNAATQTTELHFSDGQGLGPDPDGADDFDFRILADVYGFTENGTIANGATGRVIENPIAVLQHFLTNFTEPLTMLPPVAANFQDSYEGVFDCYAQNGVKLAYIINDDVTPREVMKDICSDASLRLYWTQAFLGAPILEAEILTIPTRHLFAYDYLTPIPDELPADAWSPNWKLTYQNDIVGMLEQDGDGWSVVNVFNYKLAKNTRDVPDEREWLREGSLISAESIGIHGRLAREYEFKWVRDPATARTLIGIKQFRYSNPIIRLTLKTALAASYRELARVAWVTDFRYGTNKRAVLESISVNPLTGGVELQLVATDFLWDNRYYLTQSNAAGPYPTTYAAANEAQRAICGFLCDGSYEVVNGIKVDTGVFSNGDPGKRLWPLGGHF